MIVLLIVALASAAVVVMLPDSRARLTDAAQRFAARVHAARDQAIIGAHPVSVWVNADGYGFDEHLPGGWQPLTVKPLAVSPWGEKVRAIPATADGRDRVIFDATGLTDRTMTVSLARDGETMIVVIGTNGDVRVQG